MNAPNRIFAAALVSLAAWAPLCAHAQAHQVREGGYTLRSSTVGSETIPASVARAHGFGRSPSLGILNVTVIERGRPGNGTVAAALDVHIRNLAGQEVPVDMMVDRDNGYVSYYGTYQRAPRRILSFAIRAIPKGTGRTLTLRYRDR